MKTNTNDEIKSPMMEEKTDVEWLRLMLQTQSQIKLKIQMGCPPEEFKQLSGFNDALGIVTRRLNQKIDSQQDINTQFDRNTTHSISTNSIKQLLY